MTMPPAIAQSVQKTQQWLKSLRDSGDLADEAAALRSLRIVIHQLRDRLTPAEAIDLGSQLPTFIRGIYYDGWSPAKTPEKIKSRDQFVKQIAVKLRGATANPEALVRDVFALITYHCDPGEVADIIDQLPADIKSLWPQSAQTYRIRNRY
jgi:uncharacterized protein (DUF2267 family)